VWDRHRWTFQCSYCGKSFQAKVRNARLYCSDVCKARAWRGGRLRTERPCVRCGTSFTPRVKATARYCSRACQQRDWNEQNRAAVRRYQLARYHAAKARRAG
jgi:endogenous inhibitor of DNA gyrase (YacG/DUF329 family)